MLTVALNPSWGWGKGKKEMILVNGQRHNVNNDSPED